uniref:Uncharacterized protein n=1 Tax=Chromera velia CCMP2878 TaxID=1169474 RepID=A0A0G4G699_9ALVE|eukprot:Cvel_20366.t1-p1 / transcript=Cvel_20366.t1 / gene=Cvel_20366 / organism=Chromera_velia_CCMP2878 / gene_product=hypothetical protein / transcript_product=hypothetical protein / location=Cvel_scaffold1822:12785-13970(-) / protein_length=345 / sequence_SO=supercontig / SO=protein_coding / is_pseudo=false
MAWGALLKDTKPPVLQGSNRKEREREKETARRHDDQTEIDIENGVASFARSLWNQTTTIFPKSWGVTSWMSMGEKWKDAVKRLEAVPEDQRDKTRVCFRRLIPLSANPFSMKKVKICAEKAGEISQFRMYMSDDVRWENSCIDLEVSERSRKMSVTMIGQQDPNFDVHCPALPVIYGIVKGVCMAVVDGSTAVWLQMEDAATPPKCWQVTMTDLSLFKYGSPFYVRQPEPMHPLRLLKTHELTKEMDGKSKLSVSLDTDWLRAYCQTRDKFKYFGESETVHSALSKLSGPEQKNEECSGVWEDFASFVEDASERERLNNMLLKDFLRADRFKSFVGRFRFFTLKE